MKMSNPPHPGVVIQEALDELDVSLREFARAMDIAPSTASRILTGKAALTPEMAVKLAAVIGSSAEVWLKLQSAYSLAEAEKSVDVTRLHDLRGKLARPMTQANE
ncbi:HigA family addiction module antitoxin [Cedecea colo]|uniref:Addiction module antidote protein, HigA family n=1 Tax=Cedecea colo TaxID=2552946 RepID=A0ABX0VRJ4_9ENTR|nr:HigA family addiction module antitoxin [Cedecea colo]NIY48880.1 addiction module antidote protein, HigA family [Cedecea colo]